MSKPDGETDSKTEWMLEAVINKIQQAMVSFSSTIYEADILKKDFI